MIVTDAVTLNIPALKERLEKATGGEWRLMPKPEPSRDDHGWRALATTSTHILAVERDEIWHGRSSTVNALDRERLDTLDFIAHCGGDNGDVAQLLALLDLYHAALLAVTPSAVRGVAEALTAGWRAGLP